MEKFTCTWKDPPCSHVAGTRYNLFRHRLAGHLPWIVNRFVCVYCEKGYHDRQMFETHIKSKDHAMKEHLFFLQGKSMDKCPKATATKWLQRALQEGKIPSDEYDRITSYPKVTSDELDVATVRIPGYDPISPGLTSLLPSTMPAPSQTPVHDEILTSNTTTDNALLYTIPAEAKHTAFVTQLPPSSTAGQLLAPLPPMVTPLTSPPISVVPTSVNYETLSTMTRTTPATSCIAISAQSTSIPAAASNMFNSINSLLTTATPAAHTSQEMATIRPSAGPGQSLFAQPLSISVGQGLPAVSPHQPPQLTPLPRPKRSQSQTIISSNAAQVQVPYDPPCDLLELPSPKRSRTDLVKSVRESDEATQNVLIAQSLDKLHNRMDKLEASFKNKMKEISEAQSHDLNARFNTSLSSAISEEQYLNKEYLKKLVAILQKNILSRLPKPVQAQPAPPSATNDSRADEAQ